MLKLRLLGELEVLRDDERMPLPPSKKTRALLAYLAVTGRAHRRERLCSMFWEIPNDPRGALRWSVSRLRAIVDAPGKTHITASRETVAFDSAGAEIDLLTIRTARRSGRGILAVERGIGAASRAPEFSVKSSRLQDIGSSMPRRTLLGAGVENGCRRIHKRPS